MAGMLMSEGGRGGEADTQHSERWRERERESKHRIKSKHACLLRTLDSVTHSRARPPIPPIPPIITIIPSHPALQLVPVPSVARPP